MAHLLSSTPVALWVLSAVITVLVATEHGIARAAAASLLGWAGYFLLWSFTPQLGGWEACGLYFALSVPTTAIVLLLAKTRGLDARWRQ